MVFALHFEILIPVDSVRRSSHWLSHTRHRTSCIRALWDIEVTRYFSPMIPLHDGKVTV